MPFEDRDIINDPVQRQEMIEKSGQMLSPCVEVNGHMLPDISGDEVEAYLLAKGMVGASDRQASAPTNQPCAHEMPEAAPLQAQYPVSTDPDLPRVAKRQIDKADYLWMREEAGALPRGDLP